MDRGVPGRPPLTPNLGENGLLYIPHSRRDWVSVVEKITFCRSEIMFWKWCKFVCWQRIGWCLLVSVFVKVNQNKHKHWDGNAVISMPNIETVSMPPGKFDWETSVRPPLSSAWLTLLVVIARSLFRTNTPVISVSSAVIIVVKHYHPMQSSWDSSVS